MTEHLQKQIDHAASAVRVAKSKVAACEKTIDEAKRRIADREKLIDSLEELIREEKDLVEKTRLDLSKAKDDWSISVHRLEFFTAELVENPYAGAF